MSAAGEVKILDFGVAKLRRRQEGPHRRGGARDAVLHEPGTGHGLRHRCRSDIYSLGITAFHLLTGRKPFEAKSKVEVMLMQVKTPLPQIAQFVPCDVRVASIVEKMCAKKTGRALSELRRADRGHRCAAASARRPGGRHGAAVRREDAQCYLRPRKGPEHWSPPASGSARDRAWRRSIFQSVGGSRRRRGGGHAAARSGGYLYLRGRTGVGGVPETGWIARGGLRKVQSKGGYGNWRLFHREVEAGADDPTALSAVFSATDPIHGRCYFPGPVGQNRTGQIRKSCGSTAASARR